MKFDFSDSAVKISFDSPEERLEFQALSEQDKEEYTHLLALLLLEKP